MSIPPARTIIALFLLSAVAACSSDSDSGNNAASEAVLLPDGAEAVSFAGTPLFSSEPIGESGERLQVQLEEARVIHEADPDAVDGIVWYGRRLAYPGRYRDAIDVYSRGLELHPDEPHLLRHRGHRLITIREIDRAIADLQRAADVTKGTEDEVEPDGAPNAAGIPTSTLHTNIWYHLGLAHYLKGEFASSAAAFRMCYDLSSNDDMRVAAADWLYMALRRSNMPDAAEAALLFVEEDMTLLESFAYHQRLLMYKGLVPSETVLSSAGEDATALELATLGYGVGNWYLINGDTLKAVEVFESVLETGYWAAFGYIAAEADLARIQAE